MMSRRLVLAALLLTGCAATVGANAGTLPPGDTRDEEGLASWYGIRFQGRLTASGIPFDRHTLVAAHPTLPFGTKVRVHRLSTGGTVDVEVVDRGPAAGPRAEGVIIDLSEAAADSLDFLRAGRTRVRLEILP